MSVLGMGSDAWTAIGSLAAAGATIVSAVGLWLARSSILQNTRAMELQVLESTFRDIRELEREYIRHFKAWEHQEKNAWSSSFFNTLEYLCFLVNKRFTTDESVKAFFFDDALPAWKKMYDEHVQANWIRDSGGQFLEFKLACNNQSKVRAGR